MPELEGRRLLQAPERTPSAASAARTRSTSCGVDGWRATLLRTSSLGSAAEVRKHILWSTRIAATSRRTSSLASVARAQDIDR